MDYKKDAGFTASSYRCPMAVSVRNCLNNLQRSAAMLAEWQAKLSIHPKHKGSADGFK